MRFSACTAGTTGNISGNILRRQRQKGRERERESRPKGHIHKHQPKSQLKQWQTDNFRLRSGRSRLLLTYRQGSGGQSETGDEGRVGVEKKGSACDRWTSQRLIGATQRRGPALTPVSKTRLQTADMCCHAAGMHSGSTGDEMDPASADRSTLHGGAFRCMSGCSKVNSCTQTCIWQVAAVQITENWTRFQAQTCGPTPASFKCQACARFACTSTSAHSCGVRGRRTEKWQAACAECIHLR